MSFRRRSFRPRGRTQRPTMYWVRSTIDIATGAAGARATAELVDPSTALTPSDIVDVRWTLRRLLLNMEYTVTTGFTAGQNYIVLVGVYAANETVTADPQILVAADFKTDWMWLATATLLDGATAPAQEARNIRIVDIKAMRKFDANHSPLFSVKVVRIDNGAAPAAGVLQVRGQMSSLWTATRR